MKVKDKYKAWVSATVTFVGTVVAVRYGLNIPLDQIVPWVTTAIVSASSGYLTWLVPNKPD